MATGVTVGLTGPWGTGKSSLLNMVENEIRDSFPNSVCVRFNPWLVGDHKELIGQFFSEWIMALDSSRLTRQAAYELVDYLKIYGKIVGGVT